MRALSYISIRNDSEETEEESSGDLGNYTDVMGDFEDK